ncbi:hypothetical protein [Pasteuria penetrans]|nr:hypothetical protein [Pasteuria penetrans]
MVYVIVLPILAAAHPSGFENWWGVALMFPRITTDEARRYPDD